MKILLNLSSINGYPSSTNSDQCLNYCLNDGICVLSESSPQCYCLPEWKGEHCNVIRKSNSNKKLISKEYLRTNINLRNHPCSLAPPNMCKNGGQCQYEEKEYSCICPYTHIGKRCEEESRKFSFLFCLFGFYFKSNINKQKKKEFSYLLN